MKKVIFIDRDGTILAEPSDEQVDSLEKMEFVPGAITGLKSLCGLGYELVLASNQDGLGTDAYPKEKFDLVQGKMLRLLAGEGVEFDDILIDTHHPEDNSPMRKPGVGMFGKYLSGNYDLASSYVIGDRETDRQLADNLGAMPLILSDKVSRFGSPDGMDWRQVAERVRSASRRCEVVRKTSETEIRVLVDLDGRGESHISTGLGFFDHMLAQLVHHGGISLTLTCDGDLYVDEHHTIEDCGIALGEALREALGDKRGIGRYGFVLPMDECRAMVLLDFGGRSHLEWKCKFTREYVGEMPTEMFKHFFKSLSDAMRANVHVVARGENNHHLAESVFKAFARALRQAIRRDPFSYEIPSSKNLL